MSFRLLRFASLPILLLSSCAQDGSPGAEMVNRFLGQAGLASPAASNPETLVAPAGRRLGSVMDQSGLLGAVSDVQQCYRQAVGKPDTEFCVVYDMGTKYAEDANARTFHVQDAPYDSNPNFVSRMQAAAPLFGSMAQLQRFYFANAHRVYEQAAGGRQ